MEPVVSDMSGQELKAWLQSQGLVSVMKATSRSGSWQDIIADGLVLCKLANRLKPRIVQQVSGRCIPKCPCFHPRPRNIGHFVSGNDKLRDVRID